VEIVYTPRKGGTLYIGSGPGDWRSYPHIDRNDILKGYYDFWERGDLQGRSDIDVIDRRWAGLKEYNSANASVYWAIRRLKSRGLIRRLERRHTALQLTASGIETARALALQELEERPASRV